MHKKEEISKLTNEELTKELRRLNIVSGPITSTTRKIYENRLVLYLERIKNKEENNSSTPISGSNAGDKEQQESIVANTTKCSQNNDENPEIKIPNGSSDSTLAINNNNIGTSHSSSNTQGNITTENGTSTHNDKNKESSGEKEKEEDEEESDGFFYGVWVPYSPLRISNKNKPNIFFSQKSALKAMKRYNGSRFKQFKTKEEAEKFSLTEPQLLSVDAVIDMVSNASISKKENSSSKPELKPPTLQEIQKFRVYIERNEIENIDKCLQNPRYLINTKDIPVILHEGCRLNAMHIAVKHNRLEICKKIIVKLHSPETFKIVYPDVYEDHLEFRRKHLTKLYLNSPEKIMCDTPLHLACKYGHVDIVKFLLSFPMINVKASNKDGKHPLDILCNRSSLRGEEKKRMVETLSSLFEDKAYVPLYHGDNVGKVGEPIVTVMPDASSVFSKDMRACIGPLSPSKAQTFYHLWKKSPRESKYQSIVCSDYEKGMERIGRALATKENLPYAEYWDFLEDFVNLSTLEGLEKLEKYLQNKSTQRCWDGSSRVNENDNHISKRTDDVYNHSRSELQQNNITDGIKRRLSFDNDSPPPVVIDIEKFTVEFKTSCRVSNELTSPVVDEFPNESVDLGGFTDFVTPERKEIPTVYIYGDQPSKQDMDVLRAIENSDYDLADFPHVRNWQKHLHQRQDRESWPSPGTPRYKKTFQMFH